MAAPMRTCLLKINCNRYTGILLRRWSSRKWTRSVQDVRTAEEEVESFTSRRILDPKKNPLVPFLPGDPVQKTLHEAATRRRERHVLKSRPRIYEKNIRREQRNEFIGNDTQLQTNGLKFEKLEEDDKRFGRLIMQARSKSDRSENKMIVLEGRNLIVDALKAGALMKCLYFAGSDTLENFPMSLLGDADVYKVQYKSLKLFSDVATPQGLLGIFELPRTDVPLKPAHNPLPFTLVCESFREAGNLGTLIRTAAAVGCHKVILLKGCVDIWNGKVLRAAAGGHFRVPLITDVTWPQLLSHLPHADDIQVYVVDSKQPQTQTASLAAVERIEMLNNNDMFDNSKDNDCDESDNEADLDDDRYADRQYKKKNAKQAALDSNVKEDDSYRNIELLNVYEDAPLNVDLYDSVDYTEKHPVVVMSGATSGICLPARKLAYDHFGRIVNIPMESEVDSLNCTVVGSVIMYEIARQFRNKKNNTTTLTETTV